MLLSKSVVVTGAASGIGAALCAAFASRRRRIVAIDKDADSLGHLKESLEKIGSDILVRVADVSQPLELEETTRDIAFDTWVNNAGIHGTGEFLGLNNEYLHQVMEINFFGVVHGSQIALKHFSTSGRGSLVNIASVSGLIASPFLSAYSASKHAVVGLTRSLQAELRTAGSPVHVLLVSPGFVKTPLLDKDARYPFPRWLEWMLSTPESVSSAVLRAIDQRQKEIVPTLNGKLMKWAFNMLPGLTPSMARALLSDSLTDFVLRRLRSP